MRILWACAVSLWATSAAAGGTLVSPTDNGLVLGDEAPLLLADCRNPSEISIELNGEPVEAALQRASDRRWFGYVQLSSRRTHSLRVAGRCGVTRFATEVSFSNEVADTVAVADAVVARFFDRYGLEDLGWNWGPGIFLYGLSKFAARSAHRDTYLDFIRAYHQHHLDKGLPDINRADRCAPALSALHLYLESGDDGLLSAVLPVVEHIKTATRNRLGSLDHVGTGTFESLFIPSSIWVDSLMMWSLIALQYGKLTDDAELVAFAEAQPWIFRDQLFDATHGLFFHAWNIKKDRLYPRNNTFWLRGNGWVMAYLVEALDQTEPGSSTRNRLAELLNAMAEGTRQHRLPTGYWDTVIAEPGYAYEESSGSALLAYAYAKGARLGVLPALLRAEAMVTFKAITARLKKRGPGYTLEDVSVGTNPAGKIGYSLIPRSRNLPYGVGAWLLLAEELAE